VETHRLAAKNQCENVGDEKRPPAKEQTEGQNAARPADDVHRECTLIHGNPV